VDFSYSASGQSTKAIILDKRVRISFLFVLLCGCTPPEYREVGKLLDQKTSTIGNYRLQMNLHEIKGYAEKEIWLWCQTNKTADLVLSQQVSGNQKKAAFTQIGWKRFLISPTMGTIIPDGFIEIDFHAVNDRVAYGGDWNAMVTFDSCETVSMASPDIHFGTRLNSERPGLEANSKSFFKRFTPSSDDSGGCFEVDSLYMKDQKASYRLCTRDKGKNWFESTNESLAIVRSMRIAF
jgi:hypothetical protein